MKKIKPQIDDLTIFHSTNQTYTNLPKWHFMFENKWTETGICYVFPEFNVFIFTKYIYSRAFELFCPH